MPEEARDFEVLRAELDARVHELADETGEVVVIRRAETDKEEAPGKEPASPGSIWMNEPRSGKATEVAEFPTLEEVERRHITAVLEAMNWRVSGPKGAASILGLNSSTLRSRIKKLSISRYISRKRDI